MSVKPREQFWERKFDYDDVIIIADNTKYLEEDSELASALEDNSIAIE